MAAWLRFEHPVAFDNANLAGHDLEKQYPWRWRERKKGNVSVLILKSWALVP
jgi:hypothetical protein